MMGEAPGETPAGGFGRLMSARKVLLIALPSVAIVAGLYAVQAREPDEAARSTAPGAAAPTDRPTVAGTGTGSDDRGQGEDRDGAGAAAERNLLSADQHSFERSTGGWTPQGNTRLDRDTGLSVTAGASLAVAVDDRGPWPDDTRTARAGTHHEPGHGVAVQPGAGYRASWRIHAEEAVPARCELRWYDRAGQIVDTIEGPDVTTAPDDWAQATCAGSAPQGADYASVRVYLADVDYGMVFHVDDVWLVEATPAAVAREQSPPAPQAPPTPAPPTPAPERPAAGDAGGVAQGSGGDPRSGEDVGAGNTGPTAYYAEDLGRRLTYDDLEPTGSITTTHDGQVIERKDVTGHISIAHDDVVIRAVRVRNDGGSRYSISYAPDSGARGAELSYVLVDGNDDPDNIGVNLTDFTMRHSHVFGQSTGVNFGSGSTIEYSYVHSQALKPGSHNAAMSIHGGSSARVRFNNLVGSTSSALSLYPRVSPLVDILVEGNLFNGGSYCTYAGGGTKEFASQSRDIRFLGNKFGRDLFPDCGQYGPFTNYEDRSGNEWSGNTWLDSGEPLE